MLCSDIFLRVSEPPGAVSGVWLVHGFGESGLSFREAFSSPLAAAYDLYAPDLPGFGVSPPDPGVRSIDAAAGRLVSLVGRLSGGKPVALVGHSMGSLIAVEAARRLGSQAVLVVSIEGNLTDEDTYFSRLTNQYEAPGKFYTALQERIAGQIAGLKDDDDEREALLRYRASVRLADPETLWDLGKSGVEATGDTRGAESFLALPCRRSYYWGGASPSPKSRDLLADWPAAIERREFPGAGHWLMITQNRQLYAALAEDIGAACR
jgi:pimeloyl-ACP methyl ester carboxylesterase